MNIIYNRLFNLSIGHDYFADGYAQSVQIVPTAETSRLLQNGKMLLKKLPHGVTVLYRATDDEITPMVQLEGKQKLAFVLTSENMARFQAISDFDESSTRKYSAGKILFFQNTPASASVNSNNPEIITHRLCDSVQPRLFTWSFKITGNPASVKLRVTDSDGNPVSIGKEPDGTPFPTTITIRINSENNFSQSVDLREKPKGKYLFTVLDATETTELLTQEIYCDEQLTGNNMLGIAEIVYEPVTGHLYGETEEYFLKFKKAQTFWKFFVVNKSGNIDFSVDSLKIHDAGAVNGTPYIINQFKRIYAGIMLTADTPGIAGNSIALGYTGAGDSPAVIFSGDTLAGGATGMKAKGTITIVDNSATGYTVAIGGESLKEGTHFSKGATANDTAVALAAAINGNAAIQVSAEVMKYDLVINNFESLVFGSDQEIPFFEKPKLNLELQKTSDDQVIIPHLPNPSPANLQKKINGNRVSELYVFI